MKTTIFLLPLSAALMLGTAAFAQTGQPSGYPSGAGQRGYDQSPYGQPARAGEENGRAQMNDGRGMNDATMYGSSADRMDPRQSEMGGMPIDRETSINGIRAACTGVGDQQENRARWSEYPVKLVVAGDRGEYYAGEHVTISRRGQQIADLTCNGPWVLMQLEPGSYRATVELPGHATKQISFRAPARGQHEVTVHFASSDEDFGGRNAHRATETNYMQPHSMPMDNTTTGNGATDQPPQRPYNNSMQPGPNDSNNTAAQPH